MGRQADEGWPQYVVMGTSYYMGPQGFQHPRLQRYLHTMSLAKAVPEGIKDRECKKDHLMQTSSGSPMSPRKTLFKRRCLPSRMTRVSRLQLDKMWNYFSSSGIAGHAKSFSCMWEQIWMQSRNEDTSIPMQKPMSSLCGAMQPGKTGKKCSGRA